MNEYDYILADSYARMSSLVPQSEPNNIYNRYLDDIEAMKSKYEERIKQLSYDLSRNPQRILMMIPPENILDGIDIEVIERYLRKKKLERINKLSDL